MKLHNLYIFFEIGAFYYVYLFLFLEEKMLESEFQASLIKDIKKNLPGCVVLKNDPEYIQGIPDLLILHGSKWAALECKRSASSKHQPNQDFYIKKLGAMSYANYIFPENRKEILNEVFEALRP